MGIISSVLEGWNLRQKSSLRRCLKHVLKTTDKMNLPNHNAGNGALSQKENRISFEGIKNALVAVPCMFTPGCNVIRTLSLEELVAALDVPNLFEDKIRNPRKGGEKAKFIRAVPSKKIWEAGLVVSGNFSRKDYHNMSRFRVYSIQKELGGDGNLNTYFL